MAKVALNGIWNGMNTAAALNPHQTVNFRYVQLHALESHKDWHFRKFNILFAQAAIY